MLKRNYTTFKQSMSTTVKSLCNLNARAKAEADTSTKIRKV